MGGAKVALAGGVENMSQAPFIARNIRFGTTLGANYNLEDALWSGLTDTYCKLPMALTAENLAEKYNISRERVDEFSLRSQKNWEKGQNEGAFAAEITPFKLKVKGKEVDFAVDEHPRPKTTLEGLAKLPSLFKKNGVVTAGTASVSKNNKQNNLNHSTIIISMCRVSVMVLPRLFWLLKKLSKNIT